MGAGKGQADAGCVAVSTQGTQASVLRILVIFFYFEEIYDDITWKSDSLKSHAIITSLQHVSLQERGWFYETESQ